MRKIFLSILGHLLYACITFGQTKPGEFQLKGTITGVSEGMLYMSYMTYEGQASSDSCEVNNGSFLFKGKINGPTRAILTLKQERWNDANSTFIWLEPTVMGIRLKQNEFGSAIFQGSVSQQEFDKLNAARSIIKNKYKLQLDSLNSEKNAEKRKEIRERLLPYLAETAQAELQFFSLYPQSFVTASELSVHFATLTTDSARLMYDRLGPKVQSSPYGIMLNNKLQRMIGGSPGSHARDFSALAIDSQKVSLSALQGQYILLDFWASWCVPCRKGNPHLRELYAKYKPKGMEIVGIADDDASLLAWRMAIIKDSLPWLQILRGRVLKNKPGMQPDINELYGIGSLPVRILIDPKGMIIGRYGEKEEELDAMLKKVFGE